MRRAVAGLLGAVLAVALTACAAASDDTAGAMPPDPAVASVQPSPEPALDECSTENLTVVNPGQLTVGAVGPLDEPYFVDGEPGNGEGFEAALVNAIAEGLGLRPAQVDWRIVSADDQPDPATARVDFLVGRVPVDDSLDAVAYSQPYLQAVGRAPELVDADGQPVSADGPRAVTSYALAFAPGDPLVTCVDGVLGELIADGELQALADIWLPPSDASSPAAGIEGGLPTISDEASGVAVRVAPDNRSDTP